MFIDKFPTKYKVSFIKGNFDKEKFNAAVKGFEEQPERGARCTRCYKLRLRESARIAKELGFDFFTTTLSISPHKDAVRLNEIGKELSEEYGVKYLYSDFKKKNGFKRSTEISNQYDMYRQDYCGCVYSYAQSKSRK